MLVAHVLYPVRTLGPGERVGIWVYGCHRRCKGCMSPEMQTFYRSAEIDVNRLAAHIREIRKRKPIDGITISGGEPFEQDRELAELLHLMQDITEDVLVFSGYRLEELGGSPLLGEIAVLVDGEYQEERNEEHPLKGSENQNIHYIKAEYHALYEDYIEQMRGRKAVQNFKLKDGIFAVGIQGRGFVEKIRRQAGLGEGVFDEQ